MSISTIMSLLIIIMLTMVIIADIKDFKIFSKSLSEIDEKLKIIYDLDDKYWYDDDTFYKTPKKDLIKITEKFIKNKVAKELISPFFISNTSILEKVPDIEPLQDGSLNVLYEDDKAHMLIKIGLNQNSGLYLSYYFREFNTNNSCEGKIKLNKMI